MTAEPHETVPVTAAVLSASGRDAAASAANVVTEIGLRYIPGNTVPSEPSSWLTGSVALDKEVLVTTSYWTGRARLIARRSGALRASTGGLTGPRGISRTEECLVLISQPAINRLTQLDAEGRVRRHVDLAGISPWYACQWQDRWLISDDRTKGVYLASLDGRRIERLPTPFPLRSVRSAVPVDDDRYLLCDRESQRVVVLTRAGEVVWSYGRENYPTAEEGGLTSPEHAVPVASGVVIADTRNHRVLSVDWNGRTRWSIGGPGLVGGGPGRLWHPISVSACGDRVLVTDSGNDRVLDVGPDGQVLRSYGDGAVSMATFHFPRSLESDRSRYLVADSYNNRISAFSHHGHGLEHLTVAQGKALFWPRNATVIDGVTVVSDSRNGRVLIRERSSGWRELALRFGGSRLSLVDPHTVRGTAFGWLLTDTGLNSVLLFEPRTGEVLHMWSGTRPAGAAVAQVTCLPLDDIHDAAMDDSGTVWFANTGANVIARLVRQTGEFKELRPRWPSGKVSPLCAPRTVDVRGHEILVADSGNHRVVILNHAGAITGVYGRRRGRAVDCLSDPRFAGWSDSRIAIADYLNDRVLLVPRPAMTTPEPAN